MYEFLLSEWHLPPEYIINNWTPELLYLLVDKMVARKMREVESINGKSATEKIKDFEMFALLGDKIEVIKN